jgi:hypothetical protein
MARSKDALIAQIEQDALDDRVPVATALRKCIALGGHSGSEQLRDWAARELNGYGGDDELPGYRVVNAPLMVDGFSANLHIQGQQISPSMLPDFVHEHITETLELREGVGSIEALLQQPAIRLSPPRASDIARYMNADSDDPFQKIERIYWNVSPAAIRGVLDHIRTALTQLVGGVAGGHVR